MNWTKIKDFFISTDLCHSCENSPSGLFCCFCIDIVIQISHGCNPTSVRQSHYTSLMRKFTATSSESAMYLFLKSLC